MRKANETRLNSVIYNRIRELPLTEAERTRAINAMHDAEQFAEVMLWIRKGFAALGSLLLKPSLRH